jgi:hypothetical protein
VTTTANRIVPRTRRPVPEPRSARPDSLAAGNTAIDGNWAAAEAEATGDVNGTASPSAAQDSAVNDLTRSLSDLSVESQAQGQFATAVSNLYTAASIFTNGNPGWQSQGPVVSRDISALAAKCAS